MGGEQAVALRAYVTRREHHVLCQLMLDPEVVLRGVLRTQLGFKFPKQQEGAEGGPVGRGSVWRTENPVKGIGSHRSILKNKWSAKQTLGKERASAKGGLSLKLLKHQLFDGVVEKAPAAAHRGLTISLRIPGNSNPGSKGLVVTGGKPFGNTLVSGHDQAQRKYRCGRAAGIAVGIRISEVCLACRCELARIGRSSLPRPESLIAQPCIIERLVVLPTQSIVERYIPPDFPAILRKQVDGV